MKIYKLGKGFVSDHLPYPLIDERMVPNTSFIRSMLDDYKPDVLVNCIGRTGRPNIDWCETHKEETYIANTIIPTYIANECNKRNIRLVNIGSGCIFCGTSPNTVSHYVDFDMDGGRLIDMGWNETDFANPQSYYSKTKYACDLMIADLPNTTTARIRMPVSTKNHPRNFINKIRGYSRVIDIPNSMTFMDDFVKGVDWLIQKGKTGIYHMTNPGTLSAADVINGYKEYFPDHKFEIITGTELDKITAAKRSNCVLNGNKLANEGFRMAPAHEALKQCMKTYIDNLESNG